jgi:anti-sigma regulatory factor (Ser/Thr protein kinase)
MNSPIEARIQILSRPALLSVVRHTIEAWCELAGGEESRRSRVGLAVDEAMTNVMRHGYHGERDGIIELSMRREGSVIEFTIEDRAKQVPLDRIKGRSLDNIRPGGLGVHLIREVMDEAVWSHREGGGMRLLLTKDFAVTTAVVEANNE